MKTITLAVLSGMAVFFLAIFSQSSVLAQNSIANGTYSTDFTGLWDLTGTYSAPIVVGSNTATLNFTLNQDVTGKLTGTGTFHNTGEGLVDGGLSISGMVKTVSSLSSVALTLLFSGSGFISTGTSGTDPVTGTGMMKLTCEVDGSNSELVITSGLVNSKIQDLVTHKNKGFSAKVNDGNTISLPGDVDGDCTLTLNLTPSGVKYSGSGTLLTSPGMVENFSASGIYSTSKNNSKITLKGPGGNVNMFITTSGTTMTVLSVKGKQLGQILNFIAP